MRPAAVKRPAADFSCRGRYRRTCQAALRLQAQSESKGRPRFACQACAGRPLLRRSAAPAAPNPAIIIAQVFGSGTALPRGVIVTRVLRRSPLAFRTTAFCDGSNRKKLKLPPLKNSSPVVV